MGRKFTYAIGNIVVRFGRPSLPNRLTEHNPDYWPPKRSTQPTPPRKTPSHRAQWDAAVAMHHYFQDRAEFPLGCFQGKNVLELGSGTGLGAWLIEWVCLATRPAAA